MKIIAIYDNGGITTDRYSVVTDVISNTDALGYEYRDMLGLSEGGDGFSQWTNGVYYSHKYARNAHLGKRIPFEQLSEATQSNSTEDIWR